MTEVLKKRDSNNESFERVPEKREKRRRYDHEHDSENKYYGHIGMNSKKYNRKYTKGSHQRNEIYGCTKKNDIIYDAERNIRIEIWNRIFMIVELVRIIRV